MLPDGSGAAEFGNSQSIEDRMNQALADEQLAIPGLGATETVQELTPLATASQQQQTQLAAPAVEQAPCPVCATPLKPGQPCPTCAMRLAQDPVEMTLNLAAGEADIHLTAHQMQELMLAPPKAAARQQWAKEDKALPDGSWPIPNVAFLKKACQAFPGRAKGQEGKIKAWIMKRAKALNALNIAEMGRVKSYGVNAAQSAQSEHAVTLQALHLDHTEQGDLVYKVLCKTGTLALSPGPGQVDTEQPLNLTSEMFRGVKDAFDQKAFEHVTIPETHSNGALENLGTVQSVEILSKAQALTDGRLSQATKQAFSPDPDSTLYMLGGLNFTDPKAKEKAANGSILNCSVGLKFNYRRKRDGKLFPVALEHTAITNQPWVDGLGAFGGQLSQPYDQEDQVQWDGVFAEMPESEDSPSSSAPPLSGEQTEDSLMSMDPEDDTTQEPTLEEVLAQQQATIEQLQREAAQRDELLQMAQSQLGDQGYELHESRVQRRIAELQKLGVPPAVLTRAQALMLAAYRPTGEGKLQLSVKQGEEVQTQDFDAVQQIEYLLAAMPLAQPDKENVYSITQGLAAEALQLAQQTHARPEQSPAQKADDIERRLHPERFDPEGKRQGAA